MTTLRQIVKSAYRESGIIQIGTDPDADQLEEGLTKLKSIISSLYGEELGGPFEDINFGVDGIENIHGKAIDFEPYLQSYYARPSYRLMFNINSSKTVFLDPEPYDGARFAVLDLNNNFSANNVLINANGRKIEGGKSVTLSEDGVNSQWLYRGDLGEWVKVTSLEVGSENPFPTEFDDFLIIKLAMRLHPRYRVNTATETGMYYRELLRKFRSRYSTSQEMPSEFGLYRGTKNRYLDYTTAGSSIRFAHGLVY